MTLSQYYNKTGCDDMDMCCDEMYGEWSAAFQTKR